MVSLRPRARGGSLLLAARRRAGARRLARGRDLRLALRDRLQTDRRAGALLRLVLRRVRSDRDRDGRGPLALERRAAWRTRVEPLGEPAAGPAVDGDPRDVEPVRAHVVVVLRVRDGALEELLDRFRGEDARE